MRTLPGEKVYWWKRITRSWEYPYLAEVVAVGEKRITIAVHDVEGGPARFIRHVPAEAIQPIGVYYEKATAQRGLHRLEEMDSWGSSTVYLEVGVDLWAARRVDAFENGYMLSYDRVHWVDDFGILGDMRINRNCKVGSWGRSEEIEPGEFERVWDQARSSPLWNEQVARAQMSKRGDIPIWFTIPLIKPPPLKQRTQRLGQ